MRYLAMYMYIIMCRVQNLILNLSTASISILTKKLLISNNYDKLLLKSMVCIIMKISERVASINTWLKWSLRF